MELSGDGSVRSISSWTLWSFDNSLLHWSKKTHELSLFLRRYYEHICRSH